MTLKIAFVDFWGDFDPNNNFFKDLLSTFVDVEVVEPHACDVLFFSCFGSRNIAYRNKKRVYYTGENLRPSYDQDRADHRGFRSDRCDYSLTFDFSDDPRNIRLPLWMLQIDWFNKGGYVNPEFVLPYEQLWDNPFMKDVKTSFCSFVYNNDAPYRKEIVDELSKYKQVDCFGKPHGNWFYGESNKIKCISNYKFNICFENSLHPGYYTEKPIHAKFAGCVPVYWSDSLMAQDFNPKGFLNLTDFNSVKELCDRIIEIDQDDQQYKTVRAEPLFSSKEGPVNMLNTITEKLRSIL